MSSRLLRMMPEHAFDVHVLRTFKRDLIELLTQLQASLPRLNHQAIVHIIFVLNQTFREVELSYLVWRHEQVQNTLQHGFQYARSRITAAISRRDRGKPPALFPGMSFNPPNFLGTPAQPVNHPTPTGWQTNTWTPTQADGSYYQQGFAVPMAGVWGTPQVNAAQQFPAQNTPGQRGEPATQQNQAAAQGPSYSTWSAQAAAARGGAQEFHPPPYPPPHWTPPTPVPGSPPVSVEVRKAVEVATSYVEVVNKAVSICIDSNAF